MKRLDIGVLLLAFTVTGCMVFFGQPVPTPLPIIPAWHLLLDEQPFPENWQRGPCSPTSRLCFGETHALRGFGVVGVPGHVIQDVFRLDNVEEAQAKFRTYREVDFRPRQPPNRQLLPPPEISYRSPIADEYYLGCGVDTVPACQAIFRYGNYFVDLYFSIDSGEGYGLKIEQVEPILRAMDGQASSVLGIPLPSNSD